MQVSSTEVQNNFGKYLDLSLGEEILITRNGTAVARLVGVKLQAKTLSEQLRGIIPADFDEEAIKEERLMRQWR